jgi:hypothetical protein
LYHPGGILQWNISLSSVAEPCLDDLAAGRCAALVGLSNTGKST